MKKVFLFLAAVLLINAAVFADDDYDEEIDERILKDNPFQLHMNFVNIGAGMHMVPLAGEFFIELLRFGAEHKGSGFGAGFTPFHFYGLVGESRDGTRRTEDGEDVNIPIAYGGGASIINLNVYWNILRLLRIGEKMNLGPFADLNWVIVHQNMDPTEVMFSVGMQAAIRGGKTFKFTVFAVEIGGRWIMNYSGENGHIDDGPRIFVAIRTGR